MLKHVLANFVFDPLHNTINYGVSCESFISFLASENDRGCKKQNNQNIFIHNKTENKAIQTWSEINCDNSNTTSSTNMHG